MMDLKNISSPSLIQRRIQSIKKTLQNLAFFHKSSNIKVSDRSREKPYKQERTYLFSKVTFISIPVLAVKENLF